MTKLPIFMESKNRIALGYTSKLFLFRPDRPRSGLSMFHSEMPIQC